MQFVVFLDNFFLIVFLQNGAVKLLNPLKTFLLCIAYQLKETILNKQQFFYVSGRYGKNYIGCLSIVRFGHFPVKFMISLTLIRNDASVHRIRQQFRIRKTLVLSLLACSYVFAFLDSTPCPDSRLK